MAANGNPRLVFALNANDILCGRGVPVIINEGNVRFRELVRSRKEEYLGHWRHQIKHNIATKILEEIHRRQGRFLKALEAPEEKQRLGLPVDTKVWEIISDEDAVEKIKQALRGKDSGATTRTLIRSSDPSVEPLSAAVAPGGGFHPPAAGVMGNGAVLGGSAAAAPFAPSPFGVPPNHHPVFANPHYNEAQPPAAAAATAALLRHQLQAEALRQQQAPLVAQQFAQALVHAAPPAVPPPLSAALQQLLPYAMANAPVPVSALLPILGLQPPPQPQANVFSHVAPHQPAAHAPTASNAPPPLPLNAIASLLPALGLSVAPPPPLPAAAAPPAPSHPLDLLLSAAGGNTGGAPVAGNVASLLSTLVGAAQPPAMSHMPPPAPMAAPAPFGTTAPVGNDLAALLSLVAAPPPSGGFQPLGYTNSRAPLPSTTLASAFGPMLGVAPAAPVPPPAAAPAPVNPLESLWPILGLLSQPNATTTAMAPGGPVPHGATAALSVNHTSPTVASLPHSLAAATASFVPPTVTVPANATTGGPLKKRGRKKGRDGAPSTAAAASSSSLSSGEPPGATTAQSVDTSRESSSTNNSNPSKKDSKPKAKRSKRDRK